MSSPDSPHHIAEATSALQRKQSRSSGADSIAKGDPTPDPTNVQVADPEKAQPHGLPQDNEESTLTKLTRKYRVVVLGALSALILGWWISSTVLEATRHRWCVFSPFFARRGACMRPGLARATLTPCALCRIVQTFWAWFFLL